MTDTSGPVPSRRGRFESHSQLLSAQDGARALRRMSHEILEHHRGNEGLVVIGLQTGGVPFAQTLAV